MAKEETPTRWSTLNRELKKHFALVGAYVNPHPADQPAESFLIRVAKEEAEAGSRPPYVVITVSREILEAADLDFESIVQEGIDKAKDVLDTPGDAQDNRRGVIRLERTVLFEPNR